MSSFVSKFALATTLLALALPAQNQATTLARLARTATATAELRVVAVAQPTSELLAVTFASERVLHGSVPATFTVLEPAGRCCGRSLFQLQVDDRALMFVRRVGPTFHVQGGGRGVVTPSPAIVQHVEALLAAADDRQLAAVLAAALDHGEPRVADDAALALAALPQLRLDASARQAVLQHLADCVQRGAVRSVALADVAVRLGDAPAVDAMLPLYLSAPDADQASMLRRALLRCRPGLVAERAPMFVGRERRQDLRAAELLQDLPATAGLPAMTDLLRRDVHPQVKLHLCEGLLGAGMSRAVLQPLVPQVVLDLATERRQQRPKFRNLRPGR